MGYGSQTGQRGRPATGHQSAADRVAASVARHSLVERGPECADWKRRRRLERDPARWLRYYLAEAYDRPFDEPHREIMRGVMRAHETGGRFAVAAERGIGKSTVMYGMILYLALTGRRRFPVYLPWSAPPMRRGLSFWRSALAFNQRILADYRWFAAPFAKARGYSNRMPSLRWEENGAECGALLQVSDGMIVLPDNRGAIGGSTVNGNPRGMNLPLGDGSVLRPDLALVDDPQDRKVAKSTALTTETCIKINGDIGGLGGAGSAFPLLLSGNCIAADDVMSRYIADPQWRALRISCVEKWPDGWADKGPAHKLWAEWWDEFRNDAKAGLKFYKANRPAMTQGMKLSAPHAYADKRDKTLPDALCVAMRQYWQMGHEAFMAERQQTPLSPDETAPYRLTRESIVAHATDRNPWEAPPGLITTTAGCDINPSYGLSWAVVGFEANHTAHVLGYGVDPLKMGATWSEPQKMAAVFAALSALRGRLDKSPRRPALMAFDIRGWNRDHALAFGSQAERDHGLHAIPAQGTGWKYYRPNTKARIFEAREGCHMAQDDKHRKYLVVHVDYWREIMQLAFATSPGAPGSCSLPAGNHTDFVDQILSEPLLEKKAGALGMEWLYTRRPGRNDLSDAMVMAYAAAAWGGIGTGGARVVIQRKEVRRCKVEPIVKL